MQSEENRILTEKLKAILDKRAKEHSRNAKLALIGMAILFILLILAMVMSIKL